MTKTVTEIFKEKVALLKTCEESERGNVAVEIYEHAEEMVAVKFEGGYEREYGLLRNIIHTHKPFILDLEKGIDEHSAWSHWLNVCLEEGVIEGLTDSQVIELKGKAAKYDDYVESFLFDNLADISEKQIAQLYLAQTISFYYLFENEEIENLDHVASGVIKLYLADK